MPAAAAGGMAPLSIAIRITTTGASSATSSMRAVTAASSSMSRGMGAGVISARTLGDSMRMASSLIKYTVVGVFINAGKQAIQMARQFELSFSRIKGLVVVTGNSIDVMKEKVLQLAGETTRAPIELADALYYITSAGIKDTIIALDVLEMSAKAAAAGLGTTNTVADAVTSTMNAYGVANMSAARATDVLVATVREGKAEADTFAPALGKVLPVAAAYGASFEDVSAAIAALSRGGLSAGTSAIYVRQTLSQLLKPSKAAIEVLKGVGLSAESIRDKVRDEGLFAALEMLRDKMGGLENAGDFTKVFGNVRALTAVMSLVGPAADENRKIFERLNNSTGDLDYAFKEYTSTIDSEFQRSTAESQRALIQLGNALKPLASAFLKAGTMISKGFAAFFGNSFGRGITKVVAGLVLMISVVGILMKTTSAFIRLGANLNIVLFGQQLRYDATTGAIQRYQITTAASAATTTSAAIPAVYGWVVANGFLARSLMGVRVALIGVGQAMSFVLPILTLIAMAAMAIMAIYKYFNKPQKAAEDFAGQLGKVNEVMNETAKYGDSELIFDVNVDVKNAKQDKIFEQIRSDLEGQAPELIEQVVKISEDQSKAAAAAYVKGIVATKFGGNSKEFQDNMLAFFGEQINLKPAEMAAIPAVTRFGDSFQDSLFTVAAMAAKGASGGKITFDPLKDATVEDTTLMNQLSEYNAKSTDGGKEFGQAFTDGIEETQNVGPMVNSVGRLLDLSQKAGKSAASQTRLVKNTVSGALKNLTGDYDLASDGAGNFADVFKDPANARAIEDFVAGTFKLTDNVEITAQTEKLKLAFAGVQEGSLGSVEALQILNTELLATQTKAKPLTATVFELEGAIGDVSDRFEQGLSPAIQGLADDFVNANNAIKEFERGQEALMGLARTGAEAQMAFRDSLRGLADDAGDANGSLFSGTEGADKAKSALLDSMDAVLDVANQYAASGDTAGAAQVIGEGQARIMATAMANGLQEADVSKFFEEMNFNENILETFKGAKQQTEEDAKAIGDALTAGMTEGINNGKTALFNAVGTLSDGVIERLRKALLISSPSKRMAKEVGEPTAAGFAMGFKKEMAGNAGLSIEKSLNGAITAAHKKGGRKGAASFYKAFLEKKSKVESPAGDFVKEAIGRMKDIIGSLSDYISSQLNFRKAQSELAKLINMQRGLDDRKKKAAREAQFSATRFGGRGGAEVTGYEQSKIDDLQLNFEKTSRSYAMGRASYSELLDAEIALFEARAAAAEISDDVLSAENAFIDAAVEVENKSLNLAKSTVDVLKAYQEQQEAAANLYIFHKELNGVYTDLAQATGIASGQLKIGQTDLLNLGGEVVKLGGFVSTVGSFTSTLDGKVIETKTSFDRDFFGGAGVFANIVKAGGDVNTLTKSIGADFTNLAAGLLNTDSQMYKDLASLGPEIFKAIQDAAQDSLDASPLRLKVTVNATVTTTGGGGNNTDTNTDLGKPPPLTPPKGGMVGGDSSATRRSRMTVAKAVGGPVVGMTPYLVGERGPEMFVPKVSGTIVTNSALERYTRVKEPNSNMTSSAPNNISVTVNNPVPEAAQDSITRRMKVLANSGMFG